MNELTDAEKKELELLAELRKLTSGGLAFAVELRIDALQRRIQKMADPGKTKTRAYVAAEMYVFGKAVVREPGDAEIRQADVDGAQSLVDHVLSVSFSKIMSRYPAFQAALSEEHRSLRNYWREPAQ